MDLDVMERMLLLNLLPEQGNIATLRIVRELREELSFTEQEIEAFGVQVNDNRVTWDQAKVRPREYAFKATATKLIIDMLEALDESGEVHLDHLGLMDKFGIGL